LNSSEPNQVTRHRRLRALAVALCVPCIFYGVLGAGTTLIVWTLIEFDPLRPDAYACFLAAAAPITFLLHLERQRRSADRLSIGLPLVLNLACSASAVVLAATRIHALRDPLLLVVVVLLFFAPLLNVAVLRTE
jgi:hypothetical protein